MGTALRKIVWWLSLPITAMGLWSSACEAADLKLTKQRHDLAALTSRLSKPFSSKSLVELRYVFAAPKPKEIIFRTYYSSDVSIDHHDNRCDANPDKMEIICDLRLIDNLIKQFALEGNSGYRAGDGVYRKVLLKWILAHEIGHLVLGHRASSYANIESLKVFDLLQHEKELAADAFAVKLIGNLTQAPLEDYVVMMNVANMVIRKALCPEVFPDICSNVHPGVGLIYNSGDDKVIYLRLEGTHPEYVARFVRQIHLAGQYGDGRDGIAYIARRVIEKFRAEKSAGSSGLVSEALNSPKK